MNEQPNENVTGTVRVEFMVKIVADNTTILEIAGQPEIPHLVHTDALADSLDVFEQVFQAIIHRPCAIAVTRLINQMFEAQMANKSQTTGERDVPLSLSMPDQMPYPHAKAA